jgi:hypothetical protein
MRTSILIFKPVCRRFTVRRQWQFLSRKAVVVLAHLVAP